MSKRALKWSKLNGSTRQLVLSILARGWQPGDRVRDFLPKRRHAAGGERAH